MPQQGTVPDKTVRSAVSHEGASCPAHARAQIRALSRVATPAASLAGAPHACRQAGLAALPPRLRPPGPAQQMHTSIDCVSALNQALIHASAAVTHSGYRNI